MTLLLAMTVSLMIFNEADCDSPPTIAHSTNNASSTTSRYHQYDVILYSCDNMYLPRGNSIFVCRDGAWANSGRSFECRLRECYFIDIDHGRAIIDSYGVGSIARFRCDPGYELQGPSELLCLSNSMWSDDLPTCSVRYCEELPAVNHLIRFQANEDGEFNDYTSVVTSRCEDGYRLVGDSITVCQADGTWSGEQARCERIHCGPPSVGGGMVMGLTGTHYGSIGFVECYPGFQLVGDESVFCFEGGWSGGYCYGNCTVGPISHGNAGGNPTLREGQSLSWSCDSSFVHYPRSGGSVCHNGTLVPPPECRAIRYSPVGCPGEVPGVKTTRLGDTCFITIDSAMPLDAAKAECRNSYGGKLLTVTNRTTMEYIAAVLTHRGWLNDCRCYFCACYTKVWLGLYYSDTWRWPALASARATYTNWISGEGGSWWLTGNKHERCAVLDGGNMWQWDDVDCDDSYNVVCETYAD